MTVVVGFFFVGLLWHVVCRSGSYGVILDE